MNHLQKQLSNFIRRPRTGSRHIPTRGQAAKSQLLPFPAKVPSGHQPPGLGGTEPQDRRDRVARATPAPPRHHCRTAAPRRSRGWARPSSKPRVTRSSPLLEPPYAACGLQTGQPQALTSLWSPELAPAENQRKRLRTHSTRSTRALSTLTGASP